MENGSHPSALEQALARHAVPGRFYKPLERQAVECYACGHRCTIAEGRSGICKVRFNREGVLYVPAGYTAGLQCDPIEKKPFYHVLPGSLALSFGMLGCDFHCAFCQNWLSSQVLRDASAIAPITPIGAGKIVDLAIQHGARAVISTYNEPLITSEWAMDVFARAKEQGLLTGYVSNGNASPEVIEALRPVTDLYKIDLKCFRDVTYRSMGGRLQTVLDTIAQVHALGYWMELVTLLIPGMNDSAEEIGEMAAFIASVSLDIPWHLTAYHDAYKMKNRGLTEASTLRQSAQIARQAGLRYVYIGNCPGAFPEFETTTCPTCQKPLVQREGYRVRSQALPGGTCPHCGSMIPGIWPGAANPQF
ncbi:MAG: AmmeMemoRadiSam system radical SAM enzyme [bacterium]|jgi:pyruvate formate lyase activating enzyme|nr:AmmeMemoRadiSam system radical SAM enzyme [bacterium]